MPARRKVSIRQMELLVEFAESHRDVALGRFPAGPQAVRVTREVWGSVTAQLNSVAEGTTKTADQWRRYWIELKAKTKAKAADSRRNASGTGGGPNKLVSLNEIEERVLAIIGPVAVEGLPGVRQSNIDETEEVLADSETTAPDSISSEPLMEVEWLEEEIPSLLGLQHESQTYTPSPSTATQPTDPVDIPTLEEQPEVLSREDRGAQRSTSPARRSRPQRQIRRDERTPRWAYEIETRRIAAEERHAAAMEAMVALLYQIRDDVHSYIIRD